MVVYHNNKNIIAMSKNKSKPMWLQHFLFKQELGKGGSRGQLLAPQWFAKMS